MATLLRRCKLSKQVCTHHFYEYFITVNNHFINYLLFSGSSTRNDERLQLGNANLQGNRQYHTFFLNICIQNMCRNICFLIQRCNRLLLGLQLAAWWYATCSPGQPTELHHWPSLRAWYQNPAHIYTTPPLRCTPTPTLLYLPMKITISLRV